ncbi:winged helix-turn-helix domain-containing protein [Kribbella sp. NPDC056861]|uniref:winged helix-turn-helix domain-containing protein n=1 Tax=Kribbella sp. NPDC056861 TaxID=3154857 RepID=UPI00343F039F
MLRIHFTADDLARTTVAAHPDLLWEILLSLNLVQSTEGEIWYGEWRRRVRRELSPNVARLLFELTPPVGYSPDFLTPAAPPEQMEDSLDRLVSAPRQQVRADLEYLGTRQSTSPWTRALAEGNVRTMGTLGRAVDAYHRTAIAPYWQTAARDLAAERATRRRQVKAGGIESVLGSLTDRIRWQSPVLEIPDFADEDLYLDGRGLLLQPSYFCWQAPTKFRSGDLPPVLVYPIQHGPAIAGELETDVVPSLGSLLGDTRARLLEATSRAVTTGALAESFGLSFSVALRHLGVLREAGLIESRACGDVVLHQLTRLGLELLQRPAVGHTA